MRQHVSLPVILPCMAAETAESVGISSACRPSHKLSWHVRQSSRATPMVSLLRGVEVWRRSSTLSNALDAYTRGGEVVVVRHDMLRT
eukprot:366146-Chlamydomonas_euryale.AAC.4